MVNTLGGSWVWSLTQRCCWGFILLLSPFESNGWGFLAHRYINESAVYLLPDPLRSVFLPRVAQLREQAVAADRRRAWDKEEGPRHFLDLDRWKDSVHLPESWAEAVSCYGEDSLRAHGILPWHIERTYKRLVGAFQTKDLNSVLRIAGDLGHYLGDAHVPLHLCSNYNGQFTKQHGIHALLETRIPEYFMKGMALPLRRPRWISSVRSRIWEVVHESAAPLDRVFACEKDCRARVPADLQTAPVVQGNRLQRKESMAFVGCYHDCLGGLMTDRLAQAICNLADFWFSAWVEAGQPHWTEPQPVGPEPQPVGPEPPSLRTAETATPTQTPASHWSDCAED